MNMKFPIMMLLISMLESACSSTFEAHSAKGLREIRENFESAFVVYPQSATTMQLNKSIVQRDVGYILWEATAPKIKLSLGTDTFIVRNGKITSQTHAGVATNR
jgi:hypothetical protein